MKVSSWPKTRLEGRTGAIYAGFFASLVFLIFVLPFLFFDSVSVSSDIGLLGETRERVARGRELVLLLMILPLSFGVIGFFIGVQLRKNRQLILLGASNPAAPAHLRHSIRSGFFDRRIYQLAPDGLDVRRREGAQE